jgi:hypothetical protein
MEIKKLLGAVGEAVVNTIFTGSEETLMRLPD